MDCRVKPGNDDLRVGNLQFSNSIVFSHGFAISPRAFFARGLIFNVSPLGKGVGTPGARCTRTSYAQ
jgi:hypothetical protein